jgi:uncharacterized protein CbrC (UPF0167 family)
MYFYFSINFNLLFKSNYSMESHAHYSRLHINLMTLFPYCFVLGIACEDYNLTFSDQICNLNRKLIVYL